MLSSANYGNGIELDVFAAIALGGTSLKGGSEAIYRSLIGTLLIMGVNNGLSILNVNTDLQLVAKGVIMGVAIALSRDHLYVGQSLGRYGRAKPFCTSPGVGGGGGGGRAPPPQTAKTTG
jgi:ribose/xylose/arabinose/galactoside ABC-type transport system permease subunit